MNIIHHHHRGVSSGADQKATLYHSFTYDRYYHPNFLGFSDLRVINEYHIPPKGEFAFETILNQICLIIPQKGDIHYQHSDHEKIILKVGDIYVFEISGNLSHKFSNPCDDPIEFYHFCIDITTAKDECNNKKSISSLKENSFSKIYDPENPQEVRIYIGHFQKDQNIPFPAYRHYWGHILSGNFDHKDKILSKGDSFYGDNMMDPLSDIKCQMDGVIIFFDLKHPI